MFAELISQLNYWCKQTLPSEGNLDGCGQAGGEEVGGEVGVHGQQLVGLAGSQLDAVLHGGRQGHLGQRVAGVNGCHLNTQDRTEGFYTTQGIRSKIRMKRFSIPSMDYEAALQHAQYLTSAGPRQCFCASATG